MPKLRELKARFLKLENPEGKILLTVESLAEADGVIFLCPLCFAKNNGPINTHSVICWFVGKVKDEILPKPGRWNPSGTSLDDLTFVPPGNTSVWLYGPGCGWHGSIVDGKAN